MQMEAESMPEFIKKPEIIVFAESNTEAKQTWKQNMHGGYERL